MLRSFTIIDPHLVNLIRENPRYTKMTPEEILGKFVSGRMMVKEAQYMDNCSIPKIQILKYSQTCSKFKMNFKFCFKMFVCKLISASKI
jgi:hypothetical protein